MNFVCLSVCLSVCGLVLSSGESLNFWYRITILFVVARVTCDLIFKSHGQGLTEPCRADTQNGL